MIAEGVTAQAEEVETSRHQTCSITSSIALGICRSQTPSCRLKVRTLVSTDTNHIIRNTCNLTVVNIVKEDEAIEGVRCTLVKVNTPDLITPNTHRTVEIAGKVK